MAAIREAKMEGRNADAGDGEFAEVKGNYLRKLLSALSGAGQFGMRARACAACDDR